MALVVKLIDEMITTFDTQQDAELTQLNKIQNVSAKQVVFAFIHNIESEMINESKKKGIDKIRYSLTDICKICYLFFWGKYPMIHLLNGSGEDGDEYHCNGLLLINLNDARFNYLNIYDINSNYNQLITLKQDWDKESCGICCVESIQLTQYILNKINNNNNIFNKYAHYNIVFRCGGTTVYDYKQCYDLTAIIYHPKSNKTKINPQILDIHGSDINMDAMDGYEIQLASFQNIVELNDETNCFCIFSKIYGVVVLFNNGYLLQFDWNNNWKWNILKDMNVALPFEFIAACLMKDDKGNECLFVCGVSDVNIYSFKKEKWSYFPIIDVPWTDYEDIDASDIKGTFKACYDAKRHQIYLVTMTNVYCYDVKENKWEKNYFPKFEEETYGKHDIGNFIFLDELNGDYLYCGGIDCTLNYIDLKYHNKWIEMDIATQIDHQSSLHYYGSFERIFCAK